jgi:hypothetical protein
MDAANGARLDRRARSAVKWKHLNRCVFLHHIKNDSGILFREGREPGTLGFEAGNDIQLTQDLFWCLATFDPVIAVTEVCGIKTGFNQEYEISRFGWPVSDSETARESRARALHWRANPVGAHLTRPPNLDRRLRAYPPQNTGDINS